MSPTNLIRLKKHSTFILIILTVFSVTISCTIQKPSVVNKDVTSSLPVETAIEYLDNDAGCNFLPEGMYYNGKTHSYEILRYEATKYNKDWYICVRNKSFWHPVACTLIAFEEINDERANKIVTALQSLGINPY